MNNQIEGWTLDNAVGPDPHLMQGDLVVFRESKESLKSAGIVVTADCDLKNRKHAHLVTLVPIVSVKATMEHYLLLEACEDQRKNILNYVGRNFGIDVEDDHFVVEAQLLDLANKLAEETPEKIAVDFILRRQELLSVKDYSKLITALGGKAKAASSFEDKLRKKGDIIVLPSASALGVEGEIAWVRRIWQVPIKDIAMKTSEISRCPGERVARLNSPYRYRLTQVMSQVFSDIGLPDSSRQFKNDIEKVLSNV